ncbi:hypothetical protein CEUSTIGMA_g4975.t1 [Chlamydomonas eustigma]|uniref:Uncharacterized protein n=1 Tax=Chlamydomonas eustigma TaxID=1157962 RepID=A0A250X398_9CHLO|nr:hypothetical protein CEUSTIGMA_g4975.t1 [Chlamydomonas eustigma]|eukprot:GAX77531.1 hypothetical protein CEUSTIGMA_g4975.t1 [Chlamydomonas eustigma]
MLRPQHVLTQFMQPLMGFATPSSSILWVMGKSGIQLEFQRALASSASPKESWLKRIGAALFPLHSSPDGTSPKSLKPNAFAGVQSQQSNGSTSLMSQSSYQRIQKIKLAEERLRNSQAVTQSDIFIPLSADAQQFSGNLFKAAIFMITIPLAGGFISKVLLVGMCVKGLDKYGEPGLIKISLTRIRSYIFNEYLATRFVEDDGIVLLVSLLGHANLLGDAEIMRECLETITHLLKFEEARSALLLGMATERLERAVERGWVAPSLLDHAKQVHKFLADSKKADMEAAFGVASGLSTS